MKDFIESVVIRLCHDLIGPIGTAQMALESEEYEILNNSLSDTVLKLEIFRTLFRTNINKEKAIQLLQQLKLNIDLEKAPACLLPLLFFLSQKMLSKSSIKFSSEIITLNYFFLKAEEIEIIEGKTKETNTETIFAYLALLNYQNEYKIKVKEIENKTWEMKLTKI